MRNHAFNTICSIMLMLLIQLFIFSGCTVNFVSKYDEQTDANVTAFQKSFESYFLKLDRASFPDCSLASNKAFYEDIRVQLSGAQVRANAIPRNEITTQQLDALSKAITSLEKAQEMRDGNKSCLPHELIATDRTNFNAIFTAILKFELAKKRGDSN